MSWHAQYLNTGSFKPFAGWYAVADDDKSFIGPYEEPEHAQHVAQCVTIDPDTSALREHQ